MRETTRMTGLILAALLGLAAGVHAQNLPANVPSKEQLATDNNLFLSLARKGLKWEEPEEPVKIVGPLYFVAPRASAHSCSRPPKDTF